MDFFAQQDEARQSTTRLIVLYAAAVAAIIGAIYVLCIAVGSATLSSSGQHYEPVQWIRSDIFAVVAMITLAVIGFGSLYKIAQLQKGGVAVTESLGGRLVSQNTADLFERRLINIVEEMAIASGTPVPPVYVLENEAGINAFAAGFTPESAVVAVTRGALERLSRDELQGVIAHEFSHILNGDMRLNIRLMGVLHGILVIALIGYYMMRAVGRGAGRSSGRRGGGGILALFAFGAGLAAIGFIGVFFAKLIKSGVSRQREYLADASAAQFTRNPSGIAGALKRIGGWARGSRIRHPGAEEASHFFFANGMSSFWGRIMATHPPLADRIRRIEPTFQPEEFDQYADSGAEPTGEAIAGFTGTAPQTAPSVPVEPAVLIARVGNITQEHIEYAGRLLHDLPDRLTDAARDPSGAESLVYALLLHRDVDARATQMDILRETLPDWQLSDTDRYAGEIATLGAASRLPLFDLAIPALKQLSTPQYVDFREVVNRLCASDEKTDLFEYMLKTALQRHLDSHHLGVRPPVASFYSLTPLLPECSVLLATLATIGQADPAAAERAYASAFADLGEAAEPYAIVAGRPKREATAALHQLARATPGIKKRVLHACVASVVHDGEVVVEEAELLRTVADALSCPIPPFLSVSRAA